MSKDERLKTYLSVMPIPFQFPNGLEALGFFRRSGFNQISWRLSGWTFRSFSRHGSGVG